MARRFFQHGQVLTNPLLEAPLDSDSYLRRLFCIYVAIGLDQFETVHGQVYLWSDRPRLGDGMRRVYKGNSGLWENWFGRDFEQHVCI